MKEGELYSQYTEPVAEARLPLLEPLSWPESRHSASKNPRPDPVAKTHPSGYSDWA